MHVKCFSPGHFENIRTRKYMLFIDTDLNYNTMETNLMTDNEMRVMWCEKPNEVEVRRVPIYEPADDEVLIKVAYAAICPWDVRAYSGLSSSVAFPRVLGHEVSGRVAAVGKKVNRFEIGQRVCPDMIVKCGVCPACRRGLTNRCRHLVFQQFRGGYGDYVCLPEKNIFPLKRYNQSKSCRNYRTFSLCNPRPNPI